jgi:hypothetical protein
MASSYTEGLVIELIGSGDKAGSWGDVTNSNLQALNQGVSGFSDIDLSSVGSSPYTINLVDAQAVSESTSPSRSSVIRFDGHSDGFQVNFQTNTSASERINCIIVNGHASNSLVVGTGTGGTVTIPATYSARIHGDGSGLENSFANLAVDKIALKNNEIISNETNDEIVIGADTVKVGDDGAATLSSNGNQDLILKTGNTATGSITITDGSNENIDITPNGTGKVVMDKVNIGGGEIDGTPIGANSANTGVFTSATVDDIVLNGKVITMTGSLNDTATITAGTHGALDIVTTDTAGTGADIQITADGTAELAGTTVTLDASSNVELNAGGGTVTFAQGGSTLGTITSSGWSGNAATVTTIPTLSGEVTNSANTVYIANGVIDEANLKISGSPTNDYVLTADDEESGGMKWSAQSVGDVTAVTGGTNITVTSGGGPVPTVALDSAISLTSIVAATGISSPLLTTSSAADLYIYPGSTGTAFFGAVGEAGITKQLTVQCTNAPVDIIAASTTEANSLINFKSGGIADSYIRFEVRQTGVRLTEPASGNHYINVSDESGSTGTGFRNSTDGTVEVRAKNSSTADGWGRPYHSGMASGDGAYFEGENATISNTTAAYAFTHELGSAPRITKYYLENDSGSPIAGYADGDMVDISGTMFNSDDTPSPRSCLTTWMSTAQVGASFHYQSEVPFAVMNKTSGARVYIDLADWKLVVRAWK